MSSSLWLNYHIGFHSQTIHNWIEVWVIRVSKTDDGLAELKGELKAPQMWFITIVKAWIWSCEPSSLQTQSEEP